MFGSLWRFSKREIENARNQFGIQDTLLLGKTRNALQVGPLGEEYEGGDGFDEDEQVERYISVVHPHHWLRQLSSAIYIVPVVLLTIVWNICRSSSSHHQSSFLHLAV